MSCRLNALPSALQSCPSLYTHAAAFALVGADAQAASRNVRSNRTPHSTSPVNHSPLPPLHCNACGPRCIPQSQCAAEYNTEPCQAKLLGIWDVLSVDDGILANHPPRPGLRQAPQTYVHTCTAQRGNPMQTTTAPKNSVHSLRCTFVHLDLDNHGAVGLEMAGDPHVRTCTYIGHRATRCMADYSHRATDGHHHDTTKHNRPCAYSTVRDRQS